MSAPFWARHLRVPVQKLTTVVGSSVDRGLLPLPPSCLLVVSVEAD